MKWIWNTVTLVLVIGWTWTTCWMAYGRGYHNGNYDERALQTKLIITLTDTVAKRCQ